MTDTKSVAQKSLLVRGYEVVIGFETHAQLSTRSKIFSRAATAFGAEPNTQACAVDLALPGTLPVMNKGAVERAIELGLALGSHIAPRSIFARKNYFYPDLPKGYQISQFEIPVVQGGSVEFYLGDEKKTVRLVRAHLEEDAGKSLHEDFIGQTGIDLNRAGTPLLEIVTEPDMRSTAEAVAYAKELHKIVTWIGICDGNMQEGSFRCDANVSVRKPGEPLGTRREIKNLNSFKFMQQAIDYEIRWQIDEIEDGRAIQQATVLFNPDTGETRAMRSKEDAADYRYFPDPDLPPLVIAPEWVERVRAGMTELPRVMAARFVKDYGLSDYDANGLTQSKSFAGYFETVAHTCGYPKLAANWVLGEVSAFINKEGLDIDDVEVPNPIAVGEVIKLIAIGKINGGGAKTAFQELCVRVHNEISDLAAFVQQIVEDRDLEQTNDTGALEKIVDTVLAANPKNVDEFRAGNAKALNALVGQIMKASQGKANPQLVNELLKKKLAA
ncbi:Asp-tRNA(Asn)/Glu-tRNA(Gln) amidotransferase subunit GatB [Rhodoferax fermentans]|uniref:Aspartyl/glutamyl-tRNA(Asn/Gln) amidotransferase subunit B n=1 Tax=Rhodoferax fermentans TaxID=28066 RepID=A0A1T1ASH4_RHOFE|nr:Asp-tRNA(Asn)/Glu-tRNA(Gln) amidotransferase subunit GatB [Rhodoferax fermentans]MBK1684180.1 Asp-tRNA(Asn)/Glu-tRNA(Gln) amidotransferase GatCAB subunit B [Rhodoferax fermentans]OOV07051.1 glutaminyl-tRNA synthase (glutamine-hydrolyzing) subunit B [Rhodoferax fermentans]